MKNGIPKRRWLVKSMATSGNGRSSGGSAGLVPSSEERGPLYGRGRSSREYWKRNSLDVLDDRYDTRLPFTALEWSRSSALELRAQVSTSKVPFFCSDHV